MTEKRICPNCGKELPVRYGEGSILFVGQGRLVRELTPGSVVVCAACAYVLKVVKVNGAVDLGLLTQEEWEFFQARLREFGEDRFIEMLKGSLPAHGPEQQKD